MAYVRCAISNVLFECSYMSTLKLPAHEGFPHPIFAANAKFLQTMYMKHCAGDLSNTDSYLTFLAILHSSGNIIWEVPCALDPNSNLCITTIENTIKQLISVIARTEQIRHPKFRQPKYKVTAGNSTLSSLRAWITAWDTNIQAFYSTVATSKERDELVKVENKLSNFITAGIPIEKYAATIANWADKASGGFPSEQRDEWMQTIRYCFNKEKMFKTSLKTLNELKDFCYESIEIGSIHFVKLQECLNYGIASHTDYLGGSALALGYSLVPLDNDNAGKKVSLSLSHRLAEIRDKEKENNELLNKIIEDSPLAPPVERDYPNKLAFIKAKLAYRIAIEAKKEADKLANDLKGL